MDETLYQSGLQARQEDLDNTEATKIQAILDRFTDTFTPGILSGWGITVNSGNSNLIDIGAAAGVENIAYDETGERITGPIPAVTGAVLVNNVGGPNYVFLSYLPVDGSPRAHFETGASLNTRRTGSFKIEIKTSIAAVNLDSNGRPQILLGQVLNNYGTLVIINPSGVVQLRSQLLTLVGTVAWRDNPHFRFDRVGTPQAPLLTLRWAQGNHFLVDTVSYALQGSSSTQFPQGVPFFIIAALNKNALPQPTATIILAATSTDLSQLLVSNQVLLGFITTDGTLAIVDGMLAEGNPDDSGVFDGPSAAPAQPNSRLNQILFQLKNIFGSGSWQDAVVTLSGVIQGAANVAQITLSAIGNLFSLIGKFKGSSPLTNDLVNYDPTTQTGHAHTGADGDGPRLTLDGLEVGIQRVLRLPTPTNVLYNVETTFLLDSKDYRQMYIREWVVRAEITVHFATGQADLIDVIAEPLPYAAPRRTGNGMVIETYSKLYMSRNTGLGTFSLSYVQVRLLVDSADNGKLKVTLKPLEILTGGTTPSPVNGIASVDVRKISVMMLPAFSVASPGVSPGVLITQTGGGTGSSGNGGGLPVGSGPQGDSLSGTLGLVLKTNSLKTTLGTLG